ncbi:MAG: DUF3784 domain-containing protein [Bifidobacteriaceae bacterium]|jgi:hypothetical protein|nr:DUF3784 domain-containing protein [Bifidobacteriaceae bacterium]
MVMIIFGASALLLIVLALVFRAGKGAFLAAGYNQMTPAEKATINEPAMLRSLSNLLLVNAVPLLGVGLAAQFGPTWSVFPVIVLMLAVTTVWVVRVNKNPKLRR